jgi:hypothetical protein
MHQHPALALDGPADKPADLIEMLLDGHRSPVNEVQLEVLELVLEGGLQLVAGPHHVSDAVPFQQGQADRRLDVAQEEPLGYPVQLGGRLGAPELAQQPDLPLQAGLAKRVGQGDRREICAPAFLALGHHLHLISINY